MAYSKKGYRKYKKYYKRYFKKNSLTKGNIFGHKSAKSQAKQIYKLNKKINYIQKTNAPEIKTYTTSVFKWLNDGDSIINEKHDYAALYEDRLLNYEPYTDRINMKGDLLRVKNISIYGQFGLTPDRSVIYDDVAVNSEVSITSPQTAYLRILVVRLKQGGGHIPSRITQDGPVISNLDAYRDITPIFGPLVEGIGGQMTVLKEKIIKVNSHNPFKTFKIKLSNKQAGNFKKFENWPSSYGKNEIIIYYQYLNPASLQKMIGETPKIISPGCVLSMNCKIAYIDDD